jgi:hypothetical protein
LKEKITQKIRLKNREAQESKKKSLFFFFLLTRLKLNSYSLFFAKKSFLCEEFRQSSSDTVEKLKIYLHCKEYYKSLVKIQCHPNKIKDLGQWHQINVQR